MKSKRNTRAKTLKSKRNKRAKTLLDGKEYSETIPTDLIIEILSRLPVKSLGRCRCVSKLWRSIVDLPYLTELFNIRSSARPHLLFVYREKDKFLFLSSPQPHNPDDENSSLVAVKHLSHIPFFGPFRHYSKISGPVHGLVCLIDYQISKGKISTVHTICNPSTGQALTLPKVNKTSMVEMPCVLETRSFMVYDPIYKQFKVLCSRYDFEHQVLTLGTEKMEWRIIECCIIPHLCWLEGICINGVLYYKANLIGRETRIIVCFHVRSEKFSYIELDTTFKEAVFSETMINYNGKLGSVRFELGGATQSIELMVIGDSEKQEWSKHIYMLPPVLKNVVGEGVLRFVGVTGSNEIVFSHPSGVIYYNIEKGSVVRVGIQGMEAFQNTNDLSTFLDHKELHPKLMEAFC